MLLLLSTLNLLSIHTATRLTLLNYIILSYSPTLNPPMAFHFYLNEDCSTCTSKLHMIWPLIRPLSKIIYYSSSFSYSLVTLVIFLFPKLDEVSSLTKLETLHFPSACDTLTLTL